MGKQQLIEAIETAEELTRRYKRDRLLGLYRMMYDWQHRFNAATAYNLASLLMAANQVGKSRTGCIIDAYHLTGDYPDNWEGHTFDFPPLCWLLGYSGDKIRDLLQRKLFGRKRDRELEGGWIPADKIKDFTPMTGTPNAVKEVIVEWGGGGDIQTGESVCQFWSYSQGQHALMGDVIDWYHIDEEPEDQEIYPQIVTRTLNGDRGKGGRGILTLTPENGKTELVCRFMDDPQPGQYMQTATWDDAPHLNKETKETILASYPAYQRDMRSRGVPLMGAGLIYEFSEDQLKVPRFEIPDYFWLLNGMDFGWDHPQAHVQLAIDPDSATIYVTHAWKKSKCQPYEAWEVTKEWAKGIPTAWPHDGGQHTQTDKGSAVKKRDLYEAAGWTMLDEYAQWPSGGNGVWAGITEINKLMKTDKFKIFSDLWEVFEEQREYHTKTTGANQENIQIVKIKDDLLDAIRTAYMMLRFAEKKGDIYQDEDEYEYNEEYRPASVTGY